jgi:uncharacterized protein
MDAPARHQDQDTDADLGLHQLPGAAGTSRARITSDRVTVVRWKDWSGRGLQHLVLTERPHAIVADAVCVPADDAFAARFRIRCDASWRCRALDVELVGDRRALSLRSDGRGQWTDGAGAPLPALAGAIDVDLPITPFTNTLPIRRLRLAAGEAAEIAVAYVRPPELTVEIDHQRYTCLEPLRRYRYEAVDGSFTSEIEVDDRGLAVTYPELFRLL